MTNELQERITVKLFVGCLITSDLNLLLQQNHQWKNSVISQKDSSAPSLEEVRFNNKPYLGCFLHDDSVTVPKIEVIQSYLANTISEYCPEYAVDNLKIYVFPQVFIA